MATIGIIHTFLAIYAVKRAGEYLRKLYSQNFQKVEYLGNMFVGLAFFRFNVVVFESHANESIVKPTQKTF